MILGGKAVLGFFPLPLTEARRLRTHLTFNEPFSAIDPCIGDGAAFHELLRDTPALRYGIEIDAHRAGQARALGIETLQANALDVRCPVESTSLLYLNPPYDFEIGHTDNQRLEKIFVEETYRWLQPEGVLLFVIPQAQLLCCARLIAERFGNLKVYRLTDPACVRYKQIVLLGIRLKRSERLRDAALLERAAYLEQLAMSRDLPALEDSAQSTYRLPPSGPIALTNTGIPLDDVEDALLNSSAYRQASRVLLREQSKIKDRPLTPLHGGHIGLLATGGRLNGVIGEGADRHIAHWRSVKYTRHWEEEAEDGTRLIHDREHFSHELALVFADGRTQILTHQKRKES